jgi:tetratricopeptide (TPR) repeat protein
MKISKLTSLVFVLGAILYSPKVDAQNVPNILGFARSKLASVEIFLDFNDGEAYLNRSAAHILSGDLKEAIEDSSQAIRLNPNHALAYNNRGFAHILSGDLKEAIEDFTQALRIDPNLAITHNNRGLARFKIGDLKGAIEDFTQALSIDHSLAVAQNSQDSNPGQLEDVKGTIAKLQKVAKLFKEEGKTAEYQYTTAVPALMRYILSPLIACGERVGGGVLVPHNIGKCCIDLIKKINIEPK